VVFYFQPDFFTVCFSQSFKNAALIGSNL